MKKKTLNELREIVARDFVQLRLAVEARDLYNIALSVDDLVKKVKLLDETSFEQGRKWEFLAMQEREIRVGKNVV